MTRTRKFVHCFVFLLLAGGGAASLYADDGYRLWLRYDQVSDPETRAAYRDAVSSIYVAGDSPTPTAVQKELKRGLDGLLGQSVPVADAPRAETVLVGTPDDSDQIAALDLDAALREVGPEGFVLRTVGERTERRIVVAANQDVRALYGAFELLRRLQTHQPLASLGINGTVLTNVNADATVLTPRYLDKVVALAEVFRPYGVQLYLTARFSAPIEIGGLDTADPLDPDVQQWWREKVGQIYERTPDFGGVLVEADSEGQPGLHDYDRTHAEGANMLADALAPHEGIVVWRVFVYNNEMPEDRANQAYNEFRPLDGQFRDNVLIQAKNGPIDFQPREPFHQLSGAMPETLLMMEFHITKEYLGFATHLVYMGPYREGVVDADMYAEGGAPPWRRWWTGRSTSTSTRAWPGSQTSAPVVTGPARISTGPTGTSSGAWPGIRRGGRRTSLGTGSGRRSQMTLPSWIPSRTR
jgi:alpha-glucuronidase